MLTLPPSHSWAQAIKAVFNKGNSEEIHGGGIWIEQAVHKHHFVGGAGKGRR